MGREYKIPLEMLIGLRRDYLDPSRQGLETMWNVSWQVAMAERLEAIAEELEKINYSLPLLAIRIETSNDKLNEIRSTLTGISAKR